MNNFIIFSCGYNCVDFVEEHCSSIDLQTYGKYTHILVDDGSTDGTYEKLVEYKRASDRDVRVIKYMNNIGSVAGSFVENLKPKDEDIVVVVDMDDSLADPFVLELINNAYMTQDCWMTHGSFERTSNGTIQGEPYPVHVKKERNYRTYHRWLCQHLRTFKGFLWNAVNKEDLKDETGEYARGACDMAITYPMLEMTPSDKVIFIPHILYNYNDCNPLNEFRIIKDKEQKNMKYFKSKPKYELLER